MAVWSVVDYQELEKIGRFDPEYFQPSNLKMAERLEKVSFLPVGLFADVTDGIHASPEWSETGVAHLSAKSVKEFFIDFKSAGRISALQDAVNPRTRARDGDVLITSVGTIGNAAVIEKHMLPANMDRHLGIIRVHDKGKVDPYYLAAFLNCAFGRFQTTREATGNVQLNLFIQKIRQLLVPTGQQFQAIGRKVKEALDEARQSENLYPEAEAEMLERLGWDEIQNAPRELFYVADWNDMKSSERADPEFFQPHYARLRAQIEEKGALTLGSALKLLDKGAQPDGYSEGGEIRVVKSKNVSGRGINWDSCDRTSRGVWQNAFSARLRNDDVVFNATGLGTLGRADAIRDLPGDALAAVDLMICRTDHTKILPTYLALFLNSPAGLAQSDRAQTGSSGQLHLYPQHLWQYKIFVPKQADGTPDVAWQKRLADQVLEASGAKARAREKLDEAKALVESAIGI